MHIRTGCAVALAGTALYGVHTTQGAYTLYALYTAHCVLCPLHLARTLCIGDRIELGPTLTLSLCSPTMRR